MDMHPLRTPPPSAGATTLIDLLHLRAASQPHHLAYTFLLTENQREQVTYSELAARACAVAARLQAAHAVGERVLLLYPPGLDYIVAFWGCLCAGAIAVPVYPPRRNRPSPRLAAIVQDAQARFVLTNGATLAEAGRLSTHTPELAELHWLATDNLHSNEAATWQHPDITTASIAFLQYTSGSTAAPKGVMLSHANLLDNSRLIATAFGTNPQTCGVIWLPPYHDMGLIGGILQPLHGGFPVVLMAPMAFLQQPYFWLKTISDMQATVSGGPNFAYDLCIEKITPAQRATLDLSSWQVAFNGAEPIRAETLRRFADTFAPCGFRYEAFYPCYGLAEGTLIAAGGDPSTVPIVQTVAEAPLRDNQVVPADTNEPGTRTMVSSGRELPDQRLLIVHPEHLTLCRPHEVGEIWLAGPSVAQGYWRQPDLNTITFRATLANGDGPFFRTGDLGYMHAGELYVTGRRKDLIIIRGRNYYPQDLELTVEQSHPALRPGNGAAFAVEIEGVEQLVVVQEIHAHARNNLPVAEIAIAVRGALADQHEIQLHTLLLLRTGSIPKTSSGKIQRHACRNGWRDGTLSLVGEWRLANGESDGNDSTALEGEAATPLAALQHELARILNLTAAQIAPDQPLTRLGLDSLAAVELAHTLESRWGLSLSMVDLLDGLTLSQIATELTTTRAVPPDSQADPNLSPAAWHPAPRTSHLSPVACRLSPAQHRLWFLERLAPGNPAYHVAVAVQVSGPLDDERLRASINAVIARHAPLRTTFHSVDGVPQQTIAPDGAIELPIIENTDDDDWYALVRRTARREATRPFDLERGPLIRATLLRRNATEHILLLTLHHIITDGWSMGVLAREIIHFYTTDNAALPALKWQYSDATDWQRDRLQPPRLDDLRAYWATQLAGMPPLLELPTDHPRPSTQTFNGGQIILQIPHPLRDALQTVAHRHDSTLFMVLLSAFNLLLHDLTGRDDMVVGTSVANRTHRHSQPLIGFFVNQLVLRTNLSAIATFADLLAHVRQTTLEAFKHQELPFDQIVEVAKAGRNPQYNPLFQVNFVLENAPLPELNFAGLELTLLENDSGVVPFDLSLLVSGDGDGLKAVFRYNRHLFELETIERWTQQYQALLHVITQTSPPNPLSKWRGGATAHTDKTVSSSENSRTPPLHMETAKRAARLGRGGEVPSRTLDVPQEKTIHQLFSEQASRTPHQPAVAFWDTSLTFADLESQANQLAHYLVSLGIGPEMRVGLCLTRSVSQIVALLAILKAGGAYVPLDPTYPSARLAFLLEDAQPHVVLTELALSDLLPPSARRVELDSIAPHLATLPATPPAVTVDAQNMAYLLYTSGSTGRPKGVMVQHRSVVNLAAILHEAIYSKWGRALRVSVNAPLVFDGSVKQWVQLLNGHTLVILPEEVRSDPAKLVTYMREQSLDVLDCTPSLLKKLLTANVLNQSTLQGVLVGGEAIDTSTWAALSVNHLTDFVNVYGPTEATVDATACFVRSAPAHPAIGHPLANVGIYLLDDLLNTVPDGAHGELLIGGAGLARGYWNNPALTAARFVPDPSATTPGARLYRTGDVARWRNSSGGYEYLGRLDHQVQVQGVRVELGEIETLLNNHPSVQVAAVAVRETDSADAHLVAYVVPKVKTPDLITRLRADLRSQLPLALTPRHVVQLDSLPLTRNGKLDRQALSSVESVNQPSHAHLDSAPRNAIERQIADIWQTVLGVEKVGLHDNFWDLGGHSLLLVQAFDRLQAATGRTLSLVELYRYPTVSTLAQHLAEADDNAPVAANPPVPAVDSRVQKQKEALERQRRLAGKRK